MHLVFTQQCPHRNYSIQCRYKLTNICSNITAYELHSNNFWNHQHIHFLKNIKQTVTHKTVTDHIHECLWHIHHIGDFSFQFYTQFKFYFSFTNHINAC